MEGRVLSRLVVVSNRVTVATDPHAKAGGLAMALQDALKEFGGIWFGWSGEVIEDEGAEVDPKPTLTEVGPITYATVDLGRKDFDEYYNGFANQALWPLFHYRLGLTQFETHDYNGYQRVNAHFASRLAKMLKGDEMIWIHDYHMIPLAEELRKLGVNQPIGFFLHIPFPAMEIFTALPQHREIVQGLCAYDVVGFHTVNDLRAFHDYITYEAGGGVMADNLVHAFGHTLKTGVFPIGIDTQGVVEQARNAARTNRFKEIKEELGQRQWIVGVDRLDYSKGLVHRFRSYERLLDRHEDLRGKVTLMQLAAPSRSEIQDYQEIRQSLEAESGRINGQWGHIDWVPVNYLNQDVSRTDLLGVLRASRVAMVTPLRDGMNLVAKEYVAAQNPEDPGVLVLSRFAGAAREMESALIVNPFDLDGVGDAVARGLAMPLDERKDRWDKMMNVIRNNTLDHWRESFLEALTAAPYEV